MPAPAIDLGDVVDAMAENNHSCYSFGECFNSCSCSLTYPSWTVASLTFLIYDIILSFDKEVMAIYVGFRLLLMRYMQVEYIWGSNTSIVTVLYFVMRYFTALNLTYVYSCTVAIPSAKSPTV